MAFATTSIAPVLAVGVLPGAAPKPAVHGDAVTSPEPARTGLRLPVPRRDPDEVGSACRPAALDRQKEARHLLPVAELAYLDVGREVSEERDHVHRTLPSLSISKT